VKNKPVYVSESASTNTPGTKSHSRGAGRGTAQHLQAGDAVPECTVRPAATTGGVPVTFAADKWPEQATIVQNTCCWLYKHSNGKSSRLGTPTHQGTCWGAPPPRWRCHQTCSRCLPRRTCSQGGHAQGGLNPACSEQYNPKATSITNDQIGARAGLEDGQLVHQDQSLARSFQDLTKHLLHNGPSVQVQDAGHARALKNGAGNE